MTTETEFIQTFRGLVECCKLDKGHGVRKTDERMCIIRRSPTGSDHSSIYSFVREVRYTVRQFSRVSVTRDTGSPPCK